MMRYGVCALFVMLITGLISGCAGKRELPDELAAAIDSVRMRWVPDRRTDIFNLDTVYQDGRWHLTAETSVPEVKTDLENVIGRYLTPDQRQLRISLLPEAELGDSVYALVNVSVANLRKAPRHSAELVDQATGGMVLRVLKAKSYWFLVKTASGYLGWVPGGTISRIDEQGLMRWQQARKVMVAENYACVFSQPDRNSVILSDAVLGSVFRWAGEHSRWTQVVLPGEKEGYILSETLDNYISADTVSKPEDGAIVRRARSLLGIPYLWGGNSSKGFDCSGFTGTVFRMEGRQLPRDANMQAKLGEQIEPDSAYTNVRPGDLIFFGPPDRITHVGICLGGSYFIHCSNDVHINSLDASDPLFNAYRKRNFRFIKRL